ANLYCFSERQRVEAKALLPQRVAENRDWRAAPGAVHFACKERASGGSDSKRGEVICADKANACGFFLRARAGRRIRDGDLQFGKLAVRGEDFREDLVVIPEVLKF